MSYEINLLVVNQDQPSTIPYLSRIEVINEVEDEMELRLNNTWNFMSKTNGIWYSLVKEEDGIKNAFLLCTSDFDSDSKVLPLPFWINDEDVIYNLTPLIIYREYVDEFEKILKFLVKQTNTLMFLARYQGGDHEITQGTISLSNFIQHLKNKKILFNVCYIITCD